mmetsp:Transcript_15165/g.48792  ORF Transcript_15165/g.48792 Transcript_15165/m.48792 type:complete len:216 (+) Transcript_15165:341-988(+)
MHRGRAGAARGEGGRPAAAAASAARAAARRFGAAHGAQGASGRCGGGGARDPGLVCLPDHARAARGPGCHRRRPNLRAARNHKLARAARHLPPHGGDARAHPPHTKRDGALPHPRVGRAAPPRRALSLEAPRECTGGASPSRRRAHRPAEAGAPKRQRLEHNARATSRAPALSRPSHGLSSRLWRLIARRSVEAVCARRAGESHSWGYGTLVGLD